MDAAEQQYIADICRAFWPKLTIENEQVDDEVATVAARALYEATKASSAMDFVPRPPGGVASPRWLLSQGVQVIFRSLGKRDKIYRTVSAGVAYRYATEYQMAKDYDGMVSL